MVCPLVSENANCTMQILKRQNAGKKSNTTLGLRMKIFSKKKRSQKIFKVLTVNSSYFIIKCIIILL